MAKRELLGDHFEVISVDQETMIVKFKRFGIVQVVPYSVDKGQPPPRVGMIFKVTETKAKLVN